MPVLRLPLLRSHLTLVYILLVLSTVSSTYLRNPLCDYRLLTLVFSFRSSLKRSRLMSSPVRRHIRPARAALRWRPSFYCTGILGGFELTCGLLL
jgi:hypothetical protein